MFKSIYILNYKEKRKKMWCLVVCFSVLSLQTELSSEKCLLNKYIEKKNELMKWVHGVEGELLSEHVVLAPKSVMQQQLAKFKVRKLFEIKIINLL